MSMNNQGESTAADDLYDPNRFTAEAKPRSNRFIGIVIMIFIAVMAAIGVGVFVAKKQLNQYMAARAERAEKEKAEKKAEEERTDRKGKVFTVATVGSDAALPASFGEVKLPSAEASAAPANPIPVIRNTAPMEHKPQAASARPDYGSMMLADSSGSQNATGVSSGSIPEAPYLAESRRMLANLQAQQAGANPGAAGLLAAGGNAATPASGTGQPRGKDVQEHARFQALRAPLTKTEQVTAANLGDRSFLLARGSYIPCILETQMNSNVPGYVSCVTPQNIYSDNGKVQLIEKGSHIIGEYKATLKNGDTRLAVLWQRIKTPEGVVVDVDSPAADGVGTMGAAGYVENHWMQRIGAALLLSLIEDAVAIKVAQESQGAATTQPTAVAGTTKSMSEKVLDSTINIQPTLHKNRGDRLMVFVNRDLWFDSVYNLRQR